jgi:Fe-S cluster biogenesis protein NfuA
MMKQKVEAALGKIRPSLQTDGGDVELIEVTPERVVKVRLAGACAGCPMGQMTLRMGIEKVVKREVPEVTEVVSI